MQLRQLAQGCPWLVMPEIDRKIVELMDSSWINQVYNPPDDVSQDQQKAQAIENGTMMEGFLPNVLPTDEHLTHLQTLDGYLTWATQRNQPVAPDLMGTFMQHGMSHVQAARADPQYMRQHGQDIEQFAQKFATFQKQQMAQQNASAGLARLRGPQMPGTMPGGPQPPQGMMPPPPMPPQLPTPGAIPTGQPPPVPSP